MDALGALNAARADAVPRFDAMDNETMAQRQAMQPLPALVATEAEA